MSAARLPLRLSHDREGDFFADAEAMHSSAVARYTAPPIVERSSLEEGRQVDADYGEANPRAKPIRAKVRGEAKSFGRSSILEM